MLSWLSDDCLSWSDCLWCVSSSSFSMTPLWTAARESRCLPTACVLLLSRVTLAKLGWTRRLCGTNQGSTEYSAVMALGCTSAGAFLMSAFPTERILWEMIRMRKMRMRMVMMSVLCDFNRGRDVQPGWNCQAAVWRSVVPYITVDLVWMNRLLLFYMAWIVSAPCVCVCARACEGAYVWEPVLFPPPLIW